jgi:hypothetical protein
VLEMSHGVEKQPHLHNHHQEEPHDNTRPKDNKCHINVVPFLVFGPDVKRQCQDSKHSHDADVSDAQASLHLAFFLLKLHPLYIELFQRRLGLEVNEVPQDAPLMPNR